MKKGERKTERTEKIIPEIPWDSKVVSLEGKSKYDWQKFDLII